MVALAKKYKSRLVFILFSVLYFSVNGNQKLFPSQTADNFDSKVDNLDAADDGEACEESHGAPYGGQLGLQVGFLKF